MLRERGHYVSVFVGVDATNDLCIWTCHTAGALPLPLVGVAHAAPDGRTAQ